MKTILIADDAAFMRLSLKSILERNGFQVIGEAENGEIAVKKYAVLKPDIITLDITMPVMDGLQALKKIREVDKDAKIIIISAMGQETIVREAVISGAIGFIIKPFSEEIVVKALSKVQ